VFIYLRTLIAWYCPHSHAAAAAVHRYLQPGEPTAANLQRRVFAAVGPGWDIQTNRRPDGRPVDPYSLLRILGGQRQKSSAEDCEGEATENRLRPNVVLQ